MTNVLQDRDLTAAQAREIYRRRWGVELQFRAFKQTYQRSKLRSRTPESAEVELHWSLVGLWMVQLLAFKEQSPRASPAIKRVLPPYFASFVPSFAMNQPSQCAANRSEINWPAPSPTTTNVTARRRVGTTRDEKKNRQLVHPKFGWLPKTTKNNSGKSDAYTTLPKSLTALPLTPGSPLSHRPPASTNSPSWIFAPCISKRANPAPQRFLDPQVMQVEVGMKPAEDRSVQLGATKSQIGDGDTSRVALPPDQIRVRIQSIQFHFGIRQRFRRRLPTCPHG